MTHKTAPSTKFTRDELQGFAVAGVRDRVRAIERELHRYQREFPQLFITDAPYVLLAAERREDGQTWPPVPQDRKPGQRKWTAADRKAHGAKMSKAVKAAWARRKKAAAKTTKGGVAVWQKMQAALAAAPEQRATSKELQAACGLTGKSASVAIANSFGAHGDLFKRVAPGVYTLTAAGKKGTENGATA